MRPHYDPDNPPEVPDGISRSSMRDLPFALVITDPNLEDHPIIFVNRSFERITGYTAEMALGRNCRFLQGEETDEAARKRIREAIDAEKEITLDIVNYRANGEKFLNLLMIAPLRDDDGKVTHFLGIQSEHYEQATYAARASQLDAALREMQHRVKNHLAMLLSFIRLEARRSESAHSSFEVLANRVETLSLLYHDLSSGEQDGVTCVKLGAYVSRVCSTLNMLDGQRDVIVNIDAEAIEAKVEAASQIGLLVSELLTNALQHAFPDGERGTVVVRLWQNEDDCICLQVIDDGAGLPEDCNWPEEGNLGARIVRDLAYRLDADLSVDSSEDGTRVKIAIPADALQ
ncbi:PAS domain-containing protein [Altererythrobacter aurantiacus]|uniref:PAS domain-containing protein n=1 Tax=Parapontixanthobacter aurantiacus TaxID=1463599 RepID=A0A844ZCB7_9SPHN|nr:PAS domain-containing protein [Parapontixanthobacter aurantiacus]MXO86201.1 PAS domain-containing protein [Parapontixanthobacter aurantiacus]